MSAADIYKIWSTDPFFDETTRNELLAIADNSTEIEDRFYKDLEFGTGGLRGIIGAGTNRINAYTVAKASAGLADSVRSHKCSALAALDKIWCAHLPVRSSGVSSRSGRPILRTD